MKEELINAVAKTAPPAVVSGGAAFFKLTLNEWVALATLIYIGLQAFFLVKDRIDKAKAAKRPE
jgi:hypothetical protein